MCSKRECPLCFKEFSLDSLLLEQPIVVDCCKIVICEGCITGIFDTGNTADVILCDWIRLFIFIKVWIPRFFHNRKNEVSILQQILESKALFKLL